MLFSSSPTLSHSFFSLILFQVVHLKLEANGFILVYHSFFGSHGHGREKALKGRKDSGDSRDDPQYEVGEGFEEEEEGNEGCKALLRPLWRFITKV
jgi:hypothetical protein